MPDLVSQVTWQARADPLASFEYEEASEAARFVRQDGGPDGTVVILELMRQGQSFDVAFQLVTGTTSAAFASTFPARLSATVAAYPGVALANDTPAGAGVTLSAFGFAPSTSLNITFRTPGYQVATPTGVTDSFGVYSTYFTVARGWPAGSTYTVTVSDGARTVTSTTFLPAVAASSTAGTSW